MKKNIPEFAKPDDLIPTDDRIIDLRKCDDIHSILEAFHELVYEKETESILCELCFVKKEGKGSLNPGQFIIDFDEESDTVDDEDKKKKRQSFYNLKRSIKRHFETETHLGNWKAWNHNCCERAPWCRSNQYHR